MSKKTKLRIAVAGDVTRDWFLAASTAEGVGLADSNQVCLVSRRGGAYLLEEIVRETLGHVADIIGPTSSAGDDDPYLQTYVECAPFRCANKWSWRIRRRLGTRDRSSGAMLPRVDPHSDLDILLLNDTDEAFAMDRGAWSPLLANLKDEGWLLLRCGQDLFGEHLWQEITSSRFDLRDRLMCFLHVDHVRRQQTQVSQGLSWEKTITDLCREIIHNPTLNPLLQAKHCFVSFDNNGVLHIERTASLPSGRPFGRSRLPHEDFTAHLYFDPRAVDRPMFPNRDGAVFGHSLLLMASVAYRIFEGKGAPNFDRAVNAALLGMRSAHEAGYASVDNIEEFDSEQLAFPTKESVADLQKQYTGDLQDDVWPLLGDYTKADVDLSGLSRHGSDLDGWSILPKNDLLQIDRLSRNVVIKGVDRSLTQIPYGRFGSLVTADRRELEGYRSVVQSIQAYARERMGPPHSLIVFGEPGAGKSFAVRQLEFFLRNHVGLPTQFLSFNVSQAGAGGLQRAFHHVRDSVLRGNLPVVLWDEYDCDGWSHLASFLAPMQDGVFTDSGGEHPIGKAIFFFAGGVMSSSDQALSRLTHTFPVGREPKAVEEFRAMKGPDFLSRLKGVVNLIGLDCPNGEVPHLASDCLPQPGADFSFMLRRALLLRSLLESTSMRRVVENGRASIDSGLLRALLYVPRYVHGARSLEAIVRMCASVSDNSIVRSSVPPQHFLDLHVDGALFLEIVRGRLEDNKLEELAKQAYAAYVESRKLSEITLKAWDIIDDDEKDLVLDVAGYMWSDVLLKEPAGFQGITWPLNEPTISLEQEEIEPLAIVQHTQWSERKKNLKPAHVRQLLQVKSDHPDLAPWAVLGDDQRAILRNFVRQYPTLLQRCGLGLVRDDTDAQTSKA